MHETPAAPTSEQTDEREGARYELLDPSVLQDPYPLYRRMRDEALLHRDRRFMGWILTSYDDVLAVLRDPRVSSQRPLASEPVGDPRPGCVLRLHPAYDRSTALSCRRLDVRGTHPPGSTTPVSASSVHQTKRFAEIQRLQDRSGGFGCYLMMAHEWADPQATRRSCELFARYVMPRFQNTTHASAGRRALGTADPGATGCATSGALKAWTDKHSVERAAKQTLRTVIAPAIALLS